MNLNVGGYDAQNFSSEYLVEVRKGVEYQSTRYHEFYTEMCDRIAELSRGSVAANQGLHGSHGEAGSDNWAYAGV